MIDNINDGTKPLSNQVISCFRQYIFNQIKGNDFSNEQQDVHEFIMRLNGFYQFLDPINFVTRTIIKASCPKKNRSVFLQKERKEPEEPILLVSFIQERSDSSQTSDLSKMIALNNEEFVKDELEVNRAAYSELEGSTNQSNFFNKKKDELVAITSSNEKKEKALTYIKQQIYDKKKMPSILCVQLNRFNESKQKILNPVHGTCRIKIKLDPNLDNAIKYDLNGFIVHDGNSAEFGHYIAYVKRGAKWYQANDECVTEINDSTAIDESQQAYLLFYRKK